MNAWTEPLEASSPGPGGWEVRAAERRPSCTVGLDLRSAGRAAAVAVDGRGRVRAWAVVSGDDPQDALAQLAIQQLSVKPQALRVLLGSDAVQVGIFTGATEPRADQIAETLMAGGYEPLLQPAVATVRVARATWLVAAGAEDRLHSLAEGLADHLGTEPAFVVDQLLLACGLEAGEAVVEAGAIGLSIVGLPRQSAPFVRRLPAVSDAGEAAKEARQSFGVVGMDGRIRILGSERQSLHRSLDEAGLEAFETRLASRGSETLPADLELAWRSAKEELVPVLLGPRLEQRGRSFLWARHLARAGMVLAVLGLALFAFGFSSWWMHRARLEALRTESPEIDAQLQQLKETVGRAEAIRQLRAELGAQDLPWPRIAITLATLARERPAHIGWERLSLIEGTLELEVSASGPEPLRRLELMRSVLETAPGIVNAAWDEPVIDARVARQTLRARVREAPLRDGGPEP